MLVPLSNVKAIFFDLDNTLVFSERLHFEAWQKILPNYGVDPSEIHFHEMAGRSDGTIGREVVDKFCITEAADIICEIKTAAFLTLCNEQGFEAPAGRDAFLQKAASAFKTGLVSSSYNRVIHHIIQSEKIAPFFEFTIGYEDCQRHKPDPQPYQKALEKFNLSPQEALVIEDSYAGILAAQNANIPVVGILSDQKPAQQIAGVSYFTTFTELDHWLEGHKLWAKSI